jgi:hypothetical protein
MGTNLRSHSITTYVQSIGLRTPWETQLNLLLLFYSLLTGSGTGMYSLVHLPVLVRVLQYGTVCTCAHAHV